MRAILLAVTVVSGCVGREDADDPTPWADIDPVTICRMQEPQTLTQCPVDSNDDEPAVWWTCAESAYYAGSDPEPYCCYSVCGCAWQYAGGATVCDNLESYLYEGPCSEVDLSNPAKGAYQGARRDNLCGWN